MLKEQSQEMIHFEKNNAANLLENLTGTGSTDLISWELKKFLSPETMLLTGSK
jgi:hypothetical protein